MPNVEGLLPKSPGANIKEFLVTILGEAKEEQFPLFRPTGRVWKLPKASLRMVKKSFQRAKGDLSNGPLRPDTFELQFSQHLPRSGLLHHLLQVLNNVTTYPRLFS
jgi:hypothetical protein